MFKPEFKYFGGVSPPSPKRRAEREHGDEKVASHCNIPVRTIGIILEVLALPFLIIIALLLNMPDKDLRVIGILLLVEVLMFLAGLILSHLPKEMEKEKNAKTISVCKFFDCDDCSSTITNFFSKC
jgi:hypothetical protein